MLQSILLFGSRRGRFVQTIAASSNSFQLLFVFAFIGTLLFSSQKVQAQQCAPIIDSVRNSISGAFGPGTLAKGGIGSGMTIYGRNLAGASVNITGIPQTLKPGSNNTVIQFDIGGCINGFINVETGCGRAQFPMECIPILEAPVYYDFTPKIIPCGGKTRIYIYGGGFRPDVSVLIGGITVPIVDRIQTNDFTSDPPVPRDTLVVEFEAKNFTSSFITIKSNNPQSAGAFAVSTSQLQCVQPTQAAPSITSFSPIKGGPGTLITVSGTNLQNITSVRVGRSPAQVVSQNQLGVIINIGNGRTGKIEITTPGGTAVSSEVFTFIPSPVITSVTPTIIGPGTPVYIRGTNLVNAQVTFGGVTPISVVNASDTLLVATMGTSGTITTVYPALINSAFVDNIPVNLSADGGSTVAPERIVFVKQEYARPKVALRLGNAAGGAVINEAAKTLTLNERRATFYPPEAQQTGAVLVERRNWNVSVDAVVSISYFDSNNVSIPFLRGITVTDSLRRPEDSDVQMPIPPVAVSQLPFFPARTIAPINGLWGDLLPVRSTSTLDTLRFGESVIPIRGVPTLTEANRVDVAPIIVRARWSDQLYVNNPEGFIAAKLSQRVGRQGKRRMVVQLLPSPVAQYDVDTENATATVILDDPPITAPAVINPVAERQMFAGRTDSVFIEAEADPGKTSLRSAENGGVLPKDIFYDDNYLPLKYAVRSSDATRLTVSLGTGTASQGSRPLVRFTLLPTAISGSTVAVIVTADNGLGGIATHQFIVRVQQGAPVIASVSPEAGRTGTSVTITGRDFGATPRVSFVNAAGGTIDAVPSGSSDTQITVQVPNGAETGRISVTNSIGTGQSQNDFVIVRTPQITGFTPDSAAQGTTITIRGSNFRGANRVTFGGVAASSVQVVSDSEIRAVVASGGATGIVLVANPLDSGRSTQQFVFFPPPSIQSFTPTTSGAGSTLTLTGQNFSGAGFSAPSSVRIGSRDAVFTVLSPTQMTVTVPDFGMTTVPDLTLTLRTRGGETTATTRFTFIPCPSIDNFVPASGNPQTSMTISGVGLQAVTGISIGGVPVRAWSLQSPTRISVTIGSVESGDVVITAGACSITAPGRFTYQAPARALLLQPARFTKIFPGDTQQSTLTIINQSTAPVSVGLSLSQTEDNFKLGSANTFTLRRNESTQVTVTFAPRTSGAKTATVSASIQGVSGTIDTLLTASAGLWQVAAVNFDTVRTGRSTLRNAVIVNRNTQPASIEALRLQSDGAFLLTGTSPRWVGAGDTVSAIIRCLPSVMQQSLQSVLRVESALDTGFANVSAFSRAPLASDIVLESRFVAERDTLAPGQNVALRLELTGGQNLDRLRTSAAQWRASVRWNQNVLLTALNSGAPSPSALGQFTLVRNAEPRNPLQRVNFTPQVLALSAAVPPTLVLGSVPVGVYYGSTNTTPLEFEQMSVTMGSGQTVFVEEAQSGSAFGSFTALTGGRLVQRRSSAAALTVISPNPAQNIVSVKFALPIETAVVISLVDARGNLLKTITEGWFEGGEHSVEFDASAIPSGAYRILLHTERDKLSRPVQFIR